VYFVYKKTIMSRSLSLSAAVVLLIGALVSPASPAPIALSSVSGDPQATDLSLAVSADSLIQTDISILGTEASGLSLDGSEVAKTGLKKPTKTVSEPASLLLVSVAFAGLLMYKRRRGSGRLIAERR
jgi:hypothetical protein